MDFAALQHSVFLQALGSAILNSVWQCFALWLIYQIISISYKNASAKFKTNLSTVILFFSFAWFVLNFIYKFVSVGAALELKPTSVAAGNIIIASKFWNYEALLSFATAALPYLSVAYIFLLFFLMARLVAAYKYVYFISSKHLSQPPAELKAFALLVSKQIRITRKISVWISHHVDIPATIGFIKPVILIPFASVNNLSGSQLEAIILHELSHIKRNDYVINLIISIIETILFFNPFISLLSNAIKRERENCCDDFVLQYQYDPHTYASALLSLEKSRLTNVKLAIGAVSGKKQLLSRIKRITNRQVISRQFNYGQKLLALLLVTGIICSLAWLSPPDKKAISNIILNKENKARMVVLSREKTKQNDTPEALSENIRGEILKHPGRGYKVPPSFHEAGNELSAPLPEEKIKYLNQSKKLSGASFFLDGDSLQFPSSFDIHKLPFQKMNIKINLPKGEFAKFDNKLKEALVEIKDINSSKFQGTVSQKMSKFNSDNFPSKEQLDFYIEKAANASKLFDLQQKVHAKALLGQIQSELAMQDCLIEGQDALSGKNNLRTKRSLIRLMKERKDTEDLENSFSMNYDMEAPAILNSDKLERPYENNKMRSRDITKISKKMIRISIKRLPAMATLLNDKNTLRYYFKNNSKNPERSNEVHIELSETP
jgi:beta-lactamase regulating signal transducer with metallopeptidase domain